MSKDTTKAVALQTGSTPDMITRVKAELDNLNKISEGGYKTGNSHILGCTISTETDDVKLLSLSASVSTMEDAYDRACQPRLQSGILKQVPVWKQDGFTRAEIDESIDLRLRIIHTESRRKELQQIMDEYTALLDKEDKKALLDQRLAKLVS